MALLLHAEHVILRDWHAADLLLYEQWLQPGHPWQETDGPYEPPLTPVAIDEQIARISTVIESGDPPTPRRRLVIALAAAKQDVAAGALSETASDTISSLGGPMSSPVGDLVGGPMIGTVSAYWEQQASWSINLDICIFDPMHWRQGTGYIALGLWTNYLFDELPRIVRLGMRTWSGNEGMVRLATKLGFQEEMRLRRARIVDGDYFDALGYGVLRAEWFARYPQGFRLRV